MKHKGWQNPSTSLTPATQDATPIIADQKSEKDEPENSPPIDSSPAQNLKVRVITQSLNVRRRPTKDSEVLFKVKKDTLLTQIESEEAPDDWINMIFDGKIGWVMKEFTEET